MHAILSALSPLLTAQNVVGAVLAVLGVVAGLTHLDTKRKAIVALAIHHAFLIVEDLQSNGVNIPSKAAAGLAQADAWLAANGWEPLKPQERSRAVLGFSALNGATVVPSVPAAK